MTIRRLVYAFIFGLLLILAVSAHAAVRLPSVISENMVLQMGTPVPVWGWAEPGEAVTVTFGKQKKKAVAGNDGKWQVMLDPLKAGGPFEMTIAGANTITLANVLVGEVWYCSGQSNMWLPTANALNSAEEIAYAKYPEIRLFDIINDANGEKKDYRVIFSEPQQTVEANWAACSPETVKQFSAVAYFFGREIYRDRHVPVGLIHASFGGSRVDAWMNHATLEATPAAKPTLDEWSKYLVGWPEKLAKWESDMAKWREAVKQAEAEGKRPPDEPRRPFGPGHRYEPAGAFNGMVAPVAPFAIRGVIWYQGESNVLWPRQYRVLFPAMIADWRKAWGRGDLPFLYVQLPGFFPVEAEPGDSQWAQLREAQLMTANLPHVGMITAIDLGEADQIHPANKQEISRRLYQAALDKAYGKPTEYSGPLFAGATLDGDTYRVRFTHLGGGLVVKGEKLTGFAIAGEDCKFVWADAAIDGDTVTVRCPQVAKPAAVRYAWADNPEGCNLFNKAGFPASPFRTDDWPTRPVLDKMQPFTQNKINYLRLSFKFVGEDGFKEDPPTGFIIAGEDKKFYPAQAQWFFGGILVWSDQVAKPVALRYAWPDSGQTGNITAKSGMTVAPFRSDDWAE